MEIPDSILFHYHILRLVKDLAEGRRSVRDSDDVRHSMQGLSGGWLKADGIYTTPPEALRDTDVPGVLAYSPRVWSQLKSARVFDVGRGIFNQIYHGIDVYTTEKIAGQAWSDEDVTVTSPSNGDICGWDSHITAEESEEHYRKIDTAGAKMPFPERLPFDNCLFAYGTGVVFTELSLAARLGGACARALYEDVREVRLLSHLVCHNGDVWSFYCGYTKRRNKVALFYYPTRMAGYLGHRIGEALPDEGSTGHTWLYPYSLDPWVIHALVALVNQNIAITEQKPKLSQKRIQKAAAKLAGFSRPMPMPYYTVVLRGELVDKALTDSQHERRESRPLDWRHDVRGHWRMKLQRGSLPIEAKTLDDLKKREYTVLTAGQVPAEIAEHLSRRKKPLRKEGEWIAWKLTWIADHVSPSNPNLPYVPARRILGEEQL